MTIKEVQSKQEWESFLLAQDLPPFLQSWNAKNLEAELGHESIMLGLYEQELIGICLVHLIRAKRGNYLLIPYGPVFSVPFSSERLSTLTKYLSTWGNEHGFDFIRMAPYLEKTNDHIELFLKNGYRVSPIHVLSEIVWKLDLSPSEDQLLMNMRKTTRNLIRRAKKDNVIVRKTQDSKDVDTFISLMDETHKRHEFVPYPDAMYYEQVEQFKEDNQVLVLSAEHEQDTIASAIIMYYGNVASYHHGASKRSKIPAAYRLQWEAILEAKKRGCREYSFWGIVETEDPKHPFSGISKFKKGFGGDVRYLIPSMDYPISHKYYFTYLIESIRRIKRGFGLKRTY